MTTETKVEAVAWDYSPEHRIAVTDGKGGVTMTLNGHGAPAGISLYHGDYVSELQSALDALRVEVERWKSRYDDAMQARAGEQQRADAAGRRVAECLKFIDGIREELHNRRVADWFPEGAHNAAEQMSEDMRLIGNACADFDPATLTKESP